MTTDQYRGYDPRASMKRLHLEVSGTTKVYNNHSYQTPSATDIADRIAKLADAIDRNARDIESLEELNSNKDPNHYVNLFYRKPKIRHDLNIKLRVREYLFRRWDELMKLKPAF